MIRGPVFDDGHTVTTPGCMRQTETERERTVREAVATRAVGSTLVIGGAIAAAVGMLVLGVLVLLTAAIAVALEVGLIGPD